MYICSVSSSALRIRAVCSQLFSLRLETPQGPGRCCDWVFSQTPGRGQWLRGPHGPSCAVPDPAEPGSCGDSKVQLGAVSWPHGCHSTQWVTPGARASQRRAVPSAPTLTVRASGPGEHGRVTRDKRLALPLSPHPLSPSLPDPGPSRVPVGRHRHRTVLGGAAVIPALERWRQEAQWEAKACLSQSEACPAGRRRGRPHCLFCLFLGDSVFLNSHLRSSCLSLRCVRLSLQSSPTLP